MVARADSTHAPYVSVTQFALRKGVSRARVLQLLAQRRVPGARKLGHHWIIPAAATIVQRPPVRPGKSPQRSQERVLRTLARRYI